MNPIKCFTKSCSTIACSSRPRSYLSLFISHTSIYIFDFPKFEAMVNEEYQKKIQIDNNIAKLSADEIYRNTKEYAEKTWQYVILPNIAR